MGDKSPKSKKRAQEQKNVVKTRDAQAAKNKEAAKQVVLPTKGKPAR